MPTGKLKEPRKNTCKVCDKEFLTYYYQEVYCSNECRKKGRTELRRRHIQNCPKCKEHHRRYNKEYKIKNKESCNKTERDRNRKWYICYSDVDGKTFRIKLRYPKRDYPKDNRCEICKGTRRMSYHEIDRNKPWLGIWCCCPCHNLLEGIDRGLDKVYLDLKNKILAIRLINTQQYT